MLRDTGKGWRLRAAIVFLLAATLGAAPVRGQTIRTPTGGVACATFPRGHPTISLLALTGVLDTPQPPAGMRSWHAFVCVVTQPDGHDMVMVAFMRRSGRTACEIHGRYDGPCLTASACDATGRPVCPR